MAALQLFVCVFVCRLRYGYCLLEYCFTRQV